MTAQGVCRTSRYAGERLCCGEVGETQKGGDGEDGGAHGGGFVLLLNVKENKEGELWKRWLRKADRCERNEEDADITQVAKNNTTEDTESTSMPRGEDAINQSVNQLTLRLMRRASASLSHEAPPVRNWGILT